MLVVNHGTRSTIERFRIDPTPSAAHSPGRDASPIVGRVALDYRPDNRSWTREGTILTAGVPSTTSVRDCVGSGAETCSDAFEVSEIDPRAMTSRTLARGPAGLLGGASVAVRVGDTLDVGAYSGDRILRIN